MTVNRKVTGQASSIPKGVAVGSAFSVTTTIIITAIAAHLISTEMLPEESLGYCAMAVLLTASCLGG